VPRAEPRRAGAAAVPALSGDPPSPFDPPSGCRFHPRCPSAQVRCAAEAPALAALAGRDGEHRVACHFPHDVATQ
jgi:oligopeptide/dipeptide ABC transporter ATP-binding protein